jgi:hypothetical protein
MSEQIEGTCLCGKMAFTVRDPEAMGTCHCTRCQRWTGSGSATVFVVPAKNFEITKGKDLMRTYKEEKFADRAFCGNCGSGLYAVGGDNLYVGAGLFQKPHAHKVAFHIQTAYKKPWDEIGDKSPQFPEYPPHA